MHAHSRLRPLALAAVALALLAGGCDGSTKNDGSGRNVSGGRVRVTHDSYAGVKVYDSWGKNHPAGRAQTVKPGGSSTWKDADGFCAPAKHPARYVLTWALVGRKTGTLKPGSCQKVNNIETASVTVLKK